MTGKLLRECLVLAAFSGNHVFHGLARGNAINYCTKAVELITSTSLYGTKPR
jgi:hypothetical protein